MPLQRELDACVAKVGGTKSSIPKTRYISRCRIGELDFGGVLKEYAADAAAVIARKAGIRHGLVNLGGDICIVGPQLDGQPWPVGIVHPLRTDSAIATVSLMEGR